METYLPLVVVCLVGMLAVVLFLSTLALIAANLILLAARWKGNKETLLATMLSPRAYPHKRL